MNLLDTSFASDHSNKEHQVGRQNIAGVVDVEGPPMTPIVEENHDDDYMHSLTENSILNLQDESQ